MMSKPATHSCKRVSSAFATRAFVTLLTQSVTDEQLTAEAKSDLVGFAATFGRLTSKDIMPEHVALIAALDRLYAKRLERLSDRISALEMYQSEKESQTACHFQQNSQPCA
jgi:hypothetical protein